MENLLALLPAALAMMASPGPVTLASAGFGAAYGLRAARLVLIMTAGTATIILMVATGMLGLLTALPGAAPVLMTASGAYILYLAWKIWTAPPVARADTTTQMPAALGVYAMALANPKAYAAMGALFSGFPLIEGDPLSNAIVKSVVLICFATTVNLTWMSFGTALAIRLSSPATSAMLNRVFAVLLVLSVAGMALL